MEDYVFFENEQEMLDVLRVNDIEEEAKTNSTSLFQAGLQYSKAAHKYNKIYEMRKQKEAEVFWTLKKQYMVSGEKATIRDLECQVQINPEVKKLKEAENNAELEMNKLKVLTEALRQKGVLLQGLLKTNGGFLNG